MNKDTIIKEFARSWYAQRSIPKNLLLLREFKKIPYEERSRLMRSELQELRGNAASQTTQITHELTEAKERMKTIREGMAEVNRGLNEIQNQLKTNVSYSPQGRFIL